MRVERFEAAVIGAGQAGLAVGHHLARHDVDFVMLDAASHIGDSWRHRWDSLRLFTPAGYSALPGMHFPAPELHLPDKDDVAEYLTRYADRFDLPVRLGARADSLRHDGQRFVLRTGTHVIEADNVVVATGAFQRKRIPSVARQLSLLIHQLHSSEYRNPLHLPDGPVLVVGAGNSGAQIALELARSRSVWLAGRSPGHLPRRLLGRDLFEWIWPIMSHASADTRLGRRLRERAQHNADQRIGIDEQTLADAGIVRLARVTSERSGLPECEGSVIDPRVIIWCTGFEPDYRWIELPAFADDGYPRHARGVATDVPGLYFVGLRFQHRMNSSLIGGVGADAEFIAEHVARRCSMDIAA
ncbi:MAG TPA: NAD(P)-binding domain-containing protein [Gemmatimonadaceae bacterium]|nr:NAD(P)-binding domain-containing protein [Gemmatimonadaceae bacterium]